MRALLLCRILHTGESEFQTIELVESGPFGKVLLLDGKLQSAEADEFVYHESIVHPALLYHSKSVLNFNFHNLPKQTQSLEFSPLLQT
jgi:spermidine synthase